MPIESGGRFGHYQIAGTLGAGGMGEVYLARDTRLERDVALKVLPSRLTRHPEAIARFRREALTLASLNHPNLATLYGIEDAPDGALVLVLERLEGVTRAAHLAHRRLPVDEALRIGAQLALALEVAHERRVIHRDVKPSNLMIGPRALVKVLDFGLARRMNDGATARRATGVVERVAHALSDPNSETAETIAVAVPDAPGSAGGESVSTAGPMGTPGYMSPEQVRVDELDERSDMFSFGCVLYECLAGRRAFVGP